MSSALFQGNRSRTTNLLLLLPLLLLIIFTEPVAAATFQLSGRVTDQSGSPLSGVTIEVLDPATSTAVVSATTDGNGDYALSVDEGTYDVRVTPPAGSGFVVS